MNENLNNISKKEEKLYLELGKTIKELKNEINRLRGEIGDLKKLNLSLEDVNKILLNSIDKLKVEQSSVDAKFDENINKLNKIISSLEEENKKYIEKNQVLKAGLLLNIEAETKHVGSITNAPDSGRVIGIPQRSVKDIVNKRHAVMENAQASKVVTTEIKEVVDKSFHSAKTEQPSEISTGRVQELVSKRHTTMQRTPVVPTEKSKEITREIKVEPIEEPKISHPATIYAGESSTDKSTELENKQTFIGTSAGRRVCPKCGNKNKALIREMLDKTTIISAYPRMYGKKYKCGECGNEWKKI